MKEYIMDGTHKMHGIH